MANSNRVFVSPGVYTSEKDLSFVSQSVGVSTLGLVGETKKGPAFEPVLVSSYNEFKTLFGGLSPEKIGDTLKLPLPYYAKSYLNQSSQLFVTRVLGYSGYNGGDSYVLKMIGSWDYSSLSSGNLVAEVIFNVNGGVIDLAANVVESGDINIINDAMSKSYTQSSGLTSLVKAYLENNSTSNNPIVIGNAQSYNNWDSSVDTSSTVDFFSNSVEWINQEFTDSGLTVQGYTYMAAFYTEVDPNDPNITQDKVKVIAFQHSISRDEEYHNKPIAVLRSRAEYTGDSLGFKVNSVSISSGVLENNPKGDFTLDVNTNNGVKSFVCNFDTTSKKYIKKVLGSAAFDKDADKYPLFVDEIYINSLSWGTEIGKIVGVYASIDVITDGDSFGTSWKSSETPWVVSEVRGGSVSNLFRIKTISDGDTSTEEIKVSFVNINLETQEFDILVRDFYDTDANPIVLEKFSRCSMNPDIPGYVGRKVGTADSEYELKSSYIILDIATDAPIDAVPAGFMGYVSKKTSDVEVMPVTYKTKYYTAGEVVGYDANGNAVQVNADKVRKTYLGVSNTVGIDHSVFKFKGTSSSTSEVEIKGFHLSSAADQEVFDTTGESFETGEGNFSSLVGCKFTVAPAGGFDGWDIYRETRTNSDSYILGKSGFVNGGFQAIGTDSGTSDYYSFLDGIMTFRNPEAVNINLFATPGINFYDNSSLVGEAIDMIEDERADSLYLIDSPDRDTVDEVVDDLDSIGLDSNYSATYFPWIQVRDTENSVQVYMPPTGEVLRNIALTDNVAFPWFASAGYTRGLVNAIKARKKLTLDERDELYVNRINPIATFSDVGTIIFGNKTLQVRESALDRINVRRLLLQARKLISNVAVRLLFEQNDEVVRNEFLGLVNPILENIKRERGLTDFKVVLSDSPEDIDRNQLSGKIYIKPTRALEFIDIEFLVTPTGASFENI